MSGDQDIALGHRLRELRRDAGMSGKDFAVACGWHPSKVSRLELASQRPSESDLRLWCETAGAATEYSDLVATLRTLESAHREWRHIVAGGRAPRQRRQVSIEQQARHIRWYEAWVVPGILQTPAYATAVLTSCRDLIPGGRDDVAAAVEVRMQRQRALTDPATPPRRLEIVVAEAALRQLVGGPEVMAEQLAALGRHARNPRLEVSVLPLTVPAVTGSHGFVILDHQLVMVETIGAEHAITRPSEIAVYATAFDELRSLAVRGRAAIELIKAIPTAQ